MSFLRIILHVSTRAVLCRRKRERQRFQALVALSRGGEEPIPKERVKWALFPLSSELCSGKLRRATFLARLLSKLFPADGCPAVVQLAAGWREGRLAATPDCVPVG